MWHCQVGFVLVVVEASLTQDRKSCVFVWLLALHLITDGGRLHLRYLFSDKVDEIRLVIGTAVAKSLVWLLDQWLVLLDSTGLRDRSLVGKLLNGLFISIFDMVYFLKILQKHLVEVLRTFFINFHEFSAIIRKESFEIGNEEVVYILEVLLPLDLTLIEQLLECVVQKDKLRIFILAISS